MTTSSISDNFKKWACSFSGCEGGNRQAKIWISGIEWGGGKKPNEKNFEETMSQYYNVTLKQEIEQGAVTAPAEYNWQEHKNEPYGIKLAKLYMAINGKSGSTYKQEITNYNGSEIFKINLYPIVCENVDDDLWNKYNLANITGFQAKQYYKIWCFENRFPVFRKKVAQHNPSVIIGTGNQCLNDFLACFTPCFEKSAEIKWDKIKTVSNNGSKERNSYYYWTKVTDQTTLVIVPFLGGPNGLNSDELITQMGEKIRTIADL
ncbi:hypothetical protein [Chlorobium ferrooxidans]|uniref:Uncharacterized protein n=1 Tax=Chlorobium ferrooxidans DSM 13031 TaxID=377431 RepID=Q0YUQ9_9CHLB|nr:hypothetical protein [Chlorobium ferrooxidans]EAT60144.1 hypothetical protein CferDRAFT_2151 [Chlorobium ferrooxidans DSM 13031]